MLDVAIVSGQPVSCCVVSSSIDSYDDSIDSCDETPGERPSEQQSSSEQQSGSGQQSGSEQQSVNEHHPSNMRQPVVLRAVRTPSSLGNGEMQDLVWHEERQYGSFDLACTYFLGCTPKAAVLEGYNTEFMRGWRIDYTDTDMLVSNQARGVSRQRIESFSCSNNEMKLSHHMGGDT